ncbi:MAG: hypothetical protein AAF138_09340 [Planctomycetota bacterium]
MAFNQPLPGDSAKGGTIRRLGVFLMGVAIGFVMLGLLRAGRPAPSGPPPAGSPTTTETAGESEGEPAVEPGGSEAPGP